jgi:hypothetical protein
VALLIWVTLTDERMDLSFTAVIASITSPTFTILHDGILESVVKESGSLWIPTIYSFTSTLVYMYVKYKASVSLGLAALVQLVTTA